MVTLWRLWSWRSREKELDMDAVLNFEPSELQKISRQSAQEILKRKKKILKTLDGFDENKT